MNYAKQITYMTEYIFGCLNETVQENNIIFIAN